MQRAPWRSSPSELDVTDDVGDGVYQDLVNQTSCVACPENSRRYGGFILDGEKMTAANVTACTCKEGFWRHDKVTGTKCFPCPSGAKCLARPLTHKPPVPAPVPAAVPAAATRWGCPARDQRQQCCIRSHRMRRSAQCCSSPHCCTVTGSARAAVPQRQLLGQDA